MKFAGLVSRSLIGMLVPGIAVIIISCSSNDSNNPTGPDPSPSKVYDNLTVSFSLVSVRYDCDLDPPGVMQPGDFYYDLNVDTLDSGGSWIAVSLNTEEFANIDNGGRQAPSNQKATFTLRRSDGRKFRVRVHIREADANGDDFNEELAVTHIYSASSDQLYPPESGTYTTYNATSQYGTMTLNIDKRDRVWLLDELKNEGCQLSATYSVRVQPAN